MAGVVQRYTASIDFDRRLAQHDIAGSIAHARMLGRQRVITEQEAGRLVEGLQEILDEVKNGTFSYQADLEDIHMNVEARLAEIVGEVAGKLHTGRSRNDQIALDMRLFVKEAIEGITRGLLSLQEVILDHAEGHTQTVMPGYTHLQRAQPVVLAHHLLAYVEMFQRDIERLQDCRRRADVMPLGSGALAGTPYPADRESVARELDFSLVSANSLDAVSDRDFVVELHAAASIAIMHLSRLAEEIILWSTSEFGFLELDDAYTTGSSIMPQKKNPDVAELARARTGRVYGHLMASLTVMKALPLAYNRDLQEDKEGLFDTVNTLTSTLEVFEGMLRGASFNTDVMRQVSSRGYALATDLADYLTLKGVPFREAHRTVGEVVQYAIEKQQGLDELDLSDYRRFSRHFDEDILRITPESSVLTRNVAGGTAPAQVKKALKSARRRWERTRG